MDDIIISDQELDNAINLANGIDENDTLFIALANHLKTSLWTCDKKLKEGLKKKGYKRIISTNQLFEIYLDKELKSKRMK